MMFTRHEIEQILREEIAAETKLEKDAIDGSVTFTSHGLDSLNYIYVLYQVEKRLKRELNPDLFWDFPTINSLAAHLHKTQSDD